MADLLAKTEHVRIFPDVANLPLRGPTMIDGPTQGLLQGPISQWVEELTGFALELGFDTLVFWPAGDALRQVAQFATEVAPSVREAVARARGRIPTTP